MDFETPSEPHSEPHTETGVDTLALVRPKEAVDTPWNVVVHNDPITLMDYVTMVFRKIFGFSREKAEHHMREVHEVGRSIVWTGNRERAELYVEQLHGYQLLATIEKAPR
jgi:ATP-dependent Clp protease adaptor protein ClpS